MPFITYRFCLQRQRCDCSAIAVEREIGRVYARGRKSTENLTRRGRVYLRSILRSDDLNDSRRRHQFRLHFHDNKSPFVRRLIFFFFFFFYVGETTKWTISGSLYGSLRRKRSSCSSLLREVTLGFCQRATKVAKNERCRWRDDNCRSCERIHYWLTCITLESIIMRRNKRKENTTGSYEWMILRAIWIFRCVFKRRKRLFAIIKFFFLGITQT